ncbi:hypothetical protein DRO32_03790 [Candidatus Bathyarchaeota archaeon]|nr:MAG: hypothetical protein DRO32_03790 [Candidatus Bathyarchaeota archaeon]
MAEEGVPGPVLLASTALMAALHAALASIPGPMGFRSWMIILMPLEGMILGPGPGALSAMIGGSVGCVLRGEAAILPIVAFSEPVGAASAGLALKRKWKELSALYATMLAAYFIHPFGRVLPAWCLWDIYVAFSISLVALIFSSEAFSRSLALAYSRLSDFCPLILVIRPPGAGWEPGSPLSMALSAFLGLEADSLARIFVFIPLCFYVVLGVELQAIIPLWYLGALATPVEGLLGALVASVVGPPVFRALGYKGLRCPMS